MATNDYRLCTQYESRAQIDCPAYFSQWEDLPLEIVIRKDATDEQIMNLSDRFKIPLDEMKAFRQSRALPWDAASHNPANYVQIPEFERGVRQ